MTKQEIKDTVTPDWIREQMRIHGIETVTELANRACVSRTSLYQGMSDNDPRPIAKTMKPTLLFFFKLIALEREIKQFKDENMLSE